MPAQIIQIIAFTQIMDICTPGITVWDHLKSYHQIKVLDQECYLWVDNCLLDCDMLE